MMGAIYRLRNKLGAYEGLLLTAKGIFTNNQIVGENAIFRQSSRLASYSRVALCQRHRRRNAEKPVPKHTPNRMAPRSHVDGGADKGVPLDRFQFTSTVIWLCFRCRLFEQVRAGTSGLAATKYTTARRNRDHRRRCGSRLGCSHSCAIR
jgi:hypothetical protein